MPIPDGPSTRSALRRALPRAALGLALALAACLPNAGARGPFPGFAEFEDRPVGRVEFLGDLKLPVDSLRAITSVRPPTCRIRFLPRAVCFTGVRRYELDLRDLQQDIVRLHLYYRDHGFYGTRVVPAVEAMPGDDQVQVRFGIAPGEQVTLSRLAVEGPDSLLPEPETSASLPLAEGAPFRRVAFLGSADTLRARLQRRGHAYAQVLRNYSVDTIADVAEATYVAVPGPVVRVDSIRIFGADRLERETVLKQIAVREGEILQVQDLTESQRKLYELGIVSFAGVEMAPDSLQVDADSTTATVAVRVVEAPKYLTDVALGYGTIDCLRAGVRGVDRHFLGGGRTLEVTASAAKIGVGAPLDFGLDGFCPGLRSDLFSDQITYRVAAEFLQPRLLGTRTRLSANLHAERQAELLLYLRESIGGQLNVSREVGRGILVGTGLQVERGATEASPAIFCVLFTACTERETLPLERARWTNAATLTGTLDRTTLAGQVTRGYQLRTSLVWASPALLSDDRYLSVLGEATGYRPLRPGWEVAARLQAGGFVSGSVGIANGSIPPERRFYAGGPNSVRGFSANALGPQTYVVTEEEYFKDRGRPLSEMPVQNFPLGGTHVVVGSLELRTPSPFFSQYLRLAGFVDVGQVWTAGLGGRETQVPIVGGNLVVTPGVGVRITTPVGPIRVDLGYNAYGARTGPLYLAYEDQDDALTDLELLEPRFTPPQSSFLDRLQIHIAVGQAF